MDEEQHGNPYRELSLLTGHKQPVYRVETLDCSRLGNRNVVLGGSGEGGEKEGVRDDCCFCIIIDVVPRHSGDAHSSWLCETTLGSRNISLVLINDV